jgi:large subunit ribosomal protein L33
MRTRPSEKVAGTRRVPWLLQNNSHGTGRVPATFSDLPNSPSVRYFASLLPARLFCCAQINRESAMAKGKEARLIVKLKSEASDHCYFTQKNKNNSKERLQLRKYDPIVRKHVMYKEASKV